MIDFAEVTLTAGHGGPGKVSFYRPPQIGPDGGNGGEGGSVFIEPTRDIRALSRFTTHKTLEAEKGQNGGSNRKSGREGEALVLPLPIGSVITDLDTRETWEITADSTRFLICQGGKGGLGNFEFKSSRNTTPMRAQPGLPGKNRHLQIDLKLIADFGLIGLPNAGKTSLLNELTAANAKTAEYPFTTLDPNLGTLDKKILADIPGLIEGASAGKGLGIKFLKHIEKTSVLLHCLAANTENIKEGYLAIRNELGSYNPTLLQKSEVLLITKTDLVDKETLKLILKEAKKLNKNVLAVSIHDWDSIQKLKDLLTSYAAK